MASDIEDVVKKMGAALFRGDGAYFLGSGISAESGLPDWQELLKDSAEELGLELDANDDLTEIAQYAINEHSGNRGPLIAEIKRALRRARSANDYHTAIIRTNVSTIWTTNFDTLLESRLSATRLAVRTHDHDLTSGFHEFDVELLKVHGCIDRSSADHLVVTKADYEDFHTKRPAIADRLRHDLLHKSFMFLGYSYRDPNIATALVEARRLSSGAPGEHFFIAKRERDERKRRRQELWHRDLSRFGIKTAFINEYAELKNILTRLSLASRGRSFFVTGSHKQSHQMASEVGRLLAHQSDTVLLDGQSSGVGRDAANAFGTACVEQQSEISNRVRYFPNPYAFNPAFSNDPSLLATLKQWRASLARAAHAVVVFDGSIGTEAEVEVAREMGCKIVPVSGEPGGLGARLLKDPMIAAELCPNYVQKALEGSAKASDVVDCVMRVFTK